MKSARVLKLLHISRATLVKYVKNKEIRVVELPNGFYEYNDEADETEIFEEIISMLHCFAMKIYSRRRKRKLELIKEDLKNEISL